MPNANRRRDEIKPKPPGERWTVEEIRERYHYDPETGEFFRRTTGKKLGYRSNGGYVHLTVDGLGVPAHRLAWFYVHGIWPAEHTDHINGVKHDNRIANLRPVSCAVNQQNVRKARVDSKSGFLGVTLQPHGRYRAEIRADGRVRSLGHFDTAEQAHEAYLSAKRRLHEGCTL